MKKLLATTAIATMAFTGAASAQSVLERVLGVIDNGTNLAKVNGTFANIAENIGSGAVMALYTDSTGAIYTQAEIDAANAVVSQTDFTVVGANQWINTTTGEVLTDAEVVTLGGTAPAGFVDTDSGVYYKGNDNSPADNVVVTAANLSNYVSTDPSITVTGTEYVSTGLVEGINGSITNVIDGIDSTTQQAVAGGVTATEFVMPTLNFGNMATTALGAVNTGDITLGVNSAIDNAKTTSTQALSTTMAQLGGDVDTGAIVLNVASNMTGVNGSISNTMTEVNGTVGNLSTTALGAVNTGTIVSGVNAAVQGITGTSGTPTSGQSGVVTTAPTTGG